MTRSDLILIAAIIGLWPGAALHAVPPEIIVTGRPQRPWELPEASEIPGERLTTIKPGRGVLDALAGVPSASFRETGGTGTPPVVVFRGIDPIGNRYFLEGVPLTDAQLNGAHLEPLAAVHLGEARLYPGAVPIMLGDDGIGGAIDFRFTGAESTKAGAVGARGGAYGALGAFGEQGWRGSVPGRLSLELTRADEDFVYFDDNGTPLFGGDDQMVRREHNRFQRFSFLPRFLLMRRPKSTLDAWTLHSWVDKQLPGPTSQPRRGDWNGYFQLSSARWTWRPAPESEAAVVGFARHGADLYDSLPSALGSSVDSYDTSSDAVGIRASGRFLVGKGIELQAVTGPTWDRYRVVPRSARAAAGGSRVALPVGLSTTFRFADDKISLQPGAIAHGYWYSDYGGGSSSYGLFSPRLGLRWELTPVLRLRAAVGGYYRAPSLVELYGSPNGIVASAGLSAERAIKGEVGWEAAWLDDDAFVRDLRVGYTLSLSRARDLIQFVQSSPFAWQAVNIGESRIVCHEVQASARARNGIGIRASAALVATENLSPIAYERGRELPLRPQWQWQAGVDYTTGGWTFRYSLVWHGPAYWDVANNRRLSSVVEHSAEVEWDTKAIGTLALEGRNLADNTTAASQFRHSAIETIDNTTGYPGYPAPGRRVYLTWRVPL